MSTTEFPFDDPGSYIRVQTSYYKKCLQPTIKGPFREVWMPWSTEMLRQDVAKKQIREIRKFDGFACVPAHIEYLEVIGTFYNLYRPLEWQPAPGRCDTILMFTRHIFGEQYELRLDYMTLLYKHPTEKLPVLCLVSKERKTGKSTFLDLLQLIFNKNMSYNSSADFRSQFNADWMNALIVGIEEVLLDKKEDSEKIKNLSTAKTSKIEAKNKDRREIEFFSKFVLCSNEEDNLMKIDQEETRYWVRKLPKLKVENVTLLQEMKLEVPQFLYYLLQRPMSVPHSLTRMWFSEEQIQTEALLRVMRSNRSKIETEMLQVFKEIFDATGSTELSFCNKDILELLRKSSMRVSRQHISDVLQHKWKLEPVSNSLSYQTYIYNNTNELVAAHFTGRCYTISRDWLERKFDERK